MTIGQALREGASLLSAREMSGLEVEMLLAFVLGCSRESLFVDSAEVLEEVEEKLYFSYLKRVLTGEPLAYILKGKEFFGFDFFVDERVLIPRPETELIVESALEFLRERAVDEGPVRILDLGAGSGCIGLSITKALEQEALNIVDEVFLVDLSEDALAVARLNADQLGLGHCVRVVQSDLLDFAETGERFDLIVANLPYIAKDSGDGSYVAEDVAKFEPEMALFGGANGLELYNKMFQTLIDKGLEFNFLLGEFGFGQTKMMGDVLDTYFDRNWVIKKDLAGIDRMFIVSNN